MTICRPGAPTRSRLSDRARAVAAAAITAQGDGSRRPVADNRTVEGRAMNRRVEIIVSAN